MKPTALFAITLTLTGCAASVQPRTPTIATPTPPTNPTVATPSASQLCFQRAPLLPSVVMGPGRIRLYLDALPNGLLANPPPGLDRANFLVVDVTPSSATLVSTVGCVEGAAVDTRGDQYFLCSTASSNPRQLTVQRLRGTDRLEPVSPAPIEIRENVPPRGLVLAIPPTGNPILLFCELEDGPLVRNDCFMQELQPRSQPRLLGPAWDIHGPLGFVSNRGVSLVVRPNVVAPSVGRDLATWEVVDLDPARVVSRGALVSHSTPRTFGHLPSTTLGDDGALEIRVRADPTALHSDDDVPDRIARVEGAYPIGGPTMLPNSIDLDTQSSSEGRALVLRRGDSVVRVDDLVPQNNEFWYRLETSRASCDTSGCVVAFDRQHDGGNAHPPAPFCIARPDLTP